MPHEITPADREALEWNRVEQQSRDDAVRPLAVGDVLHGFCGGYFGRDHYECCVIEAAGPDWIVTRELDRDRYGTGLDFASGREGLVKLRQYRTPTTKPADGITPCCDPTTR